MCPRESLCNLHTWHGTSTLSQSWSQCCSRARASAVEVYPGWGVTSIRCPGMTSHPFHHLWEIYQSRPILVGIMDMSVSICSCLTRYLLCLHPVSWLHLHPVLWLLHLHPILWLLVSTYSPGSFVSTGSTWLHLSTPWDLQPYSVIRNYSFNDFAVASSMDSSFGSVLCPVLSLCRCQSCYICLLMQLLWFGSVFIKCQ